MLRSAVERQFEIIGEALKHQVFVGDRNIAHGAELKNWQGNQSDALRQVEQAGTYDPCTSA